MIIETRVKTIKDKYTKYLVLSATAAGLIALTGLVWPDVIAIPGVITIALIGITGSNYLYDKGIPNNLSRRFAPVMGGVAYLSAVLWLDKWVAITVSAVMALLLIVLRMRFRTGLRGVKGNHPAQSWAEITYPIIGTLSLIIGWGILGEKWLGFLPVAFMAWGDTAAGLARDTISDDSSPSILTMAAMLVVCLGAAAVFFSPLWIGIAGAAVATLAERYRPGILGFWDDNVYIVVESLVVMGTLLELSS